MGGDCIFAFNRIIINYKFIKFVVKIPRPLGRGVRHPNTKQNL